MREPNGRLDIPFAIGVVVILAVRKVLGVLW